MKRRELLRYANTAAIGALAGCATRGGSLGGDPRICSEELVQEYEDAFSKVYISQIRPNPQGRDPSLLNTETVLIEVPDKGRYDLSGYSLTYCGRETFVFPDIVSDVTTGAGSDTTVLIHSGKGKDSKSHREYPDYSLYVGRQKPLLDNSGMQLTLRDASGDVVDSVKYPSLGQGNVFNYCRGHDPDCYHVYGPEAGDG